MKPKLITFAMSAALSLIAGMLSGCGQGATNRGEIPTELTISKSTLSDKIKGGWAGQTIGCSYGSVTEFKYRGTMIQDYVPIEWNDGYIKHFFDTWPQLYDDIYMDLTFVEVFDRLGLDAPTDSFAMAFATADYHLWHANQAARFNILNGIMPPESGHWMNNPHADDIDFQIEADFAGLMSPGMPNTAAEISDRIGHIMNYGDGWYGGVYVSAMYSLAFVSDDIDFIVREALATIPEKSKFHQCISDVIRWHEEYPNDWKQTWFECQRKWSSDIGCPEGVFDQLDIDALINSAYVVIGLLYGDGDFEETMEISTRCGQDSDCNPATAAGILGTVIGYSNISDKWKKDLKEVEDINFCYTNISLNKTYELSLNQAIENVKRNGGSVDGDNITIKCQNPVSVKLEQAFEGMYPIAKRPINRRVNDVGEITFEGNGAAFRGAVGSSDKSYVAEVEMYIDGQLAEKAFLPASYTTRRYELFWKYLLDEGRHTATFKWLNPQDNAWVDFHEILIYTGKEPSQNEK